MASIGEWLNLIILYERFIYAQLRLWFFSHHTYYGVYCTSHRFFVLSSQAYAFFESTPMYLLPSLFLCITIPLLIALPTLMNQSGQCDPAKTCHKFTL